MLIPAPKAWGSWGGWRGCLSVLQGAWPTSLEDQNISSNISCYRKNMGQNLHARSLLVFDTLQAVAFRFVCFFVCLLFKKDTTYLFPGAWEELRAGIYNGVNAPWNVTRANSVLQGLASVTPLLWCSSPWEQVTSC